MITGQKPRIPITFHLNLSRDKDSLCKNNDFCKRLPPHSHYNNDYQNEKFRHHVPNEICKSFLEREEIMLRIHSSIHKNQQERLKN